MISIEPVRQQMLLLTLQQYGEPYVWGGKGEDKWDCSGLVWYVLNKVGLYPAARTTAQVLYNVMSHDGNSVVELEDTLPMDIVFYGQDVDSVSHVGFVLPPNAMIGANGTKTRGGMVDVRKINYHPLPVVAYINPVIAYQKKYGTPV